MEWIKANLWEIKQSSSLKILGFFISLVYIINGFIWFLNEPGVFSSINSQTPFCWSFLPQCQNLNLSLTGNFILLKSLVISSIIASLLFLSFNFLTLAWFFLQICFFIQVFYFFYDLRLNNNAQILLIILTFCYLYIPQKIKVIKALSISFFLAWGWVQLNRDWLSGVWLSQKIQTLSQKGLEWIAGISAVLVLVFPWFLLNRDRQKFTLGTLVLLSYSGFLFYVKNYVLSSLVTSIVLFFVVHFIETLKLERESLYQSYIRPKPSHMWLAISLVMFWSIQLVPQLVPQLRLQELPFQIKTPPVPEKCNQTYVLIYKNKVIEKEQELIKDYNSPYACHPYLRFLQAKNLCRNLKEQPDFVNLTSIFSTRKLSESDMRQVFSSNNFCSEKVKFYNLVESLLAEES